MKKKLLKNYTYIGLGFPVKLQNVTLLFVDNQWHPKIDVKKIAEFVIKKLPSQTEYFTGNQVKFIRTYFEMSLREFAKKVVKESHAAVAKWENLKNKPTKMDVNIEIMLRLYILNHTNKTEKQKKAFLSKYEFLINTDFTPKPPELILMKAS